MESFYKNTHTLTQIDADLRMALCAVCGPVDIHPRPDGNRKVPWKCGQQQRDSALRNYRRIPASERIKAWSESSIRPRKAVMRQEKRKRYRADVIKSLGGRCSNPQCNWVNADGSIGCTDDRCLQVDHVFGDGHTERVDYGNPRHYRKVIENDGGRYQLLCANCNWIKRSNAGEGCRHRIHSASALERTS